MMAELLELTVAEAAERDRAPGELSAGRVLRRLAGGRRRRRAERLPLARPRTATPSAIAVERPAGGVPIAVKDIFCTEGDADHGRLADPRGLPAALHGDRGAQADARPARRSSARPTWTSSRWAPRTRTRPTGRCSTPGTAAASPAAPPAARPRPSPAASRPGRSAPTPAARSASPRRSAGSSG